MSLECLAAHHPRTHTRACARAPTAHTRIHHPHPPAAGVEITKLFVEYGADLDAETPKGWTPLSYAKAKGKYGATEEKGIYPEVSRWMDGGAR